MSASRNPARIWIWATAYAAAAALGPLAAWQLGWMAPAPGPVQPAAADASRPIAGTPAGDATAAPQPVSAPGADVPRGTAAPPLADTRTLDASRALARVLERPEGKRITAASTAAMNDVAGVETDEQRKEAERAVQDFNDSTDRQLARQPDSESRERLLEELMESEKNLYFKHQLLARLRQELSSRAPAADN